MTKKELASAARIRLRLEHAKIIANRSDFKRHRVGAIIVYPSPQFNFSVGWSHYSELRLERYPVSIHAELHAVLRSPFRKDLFNSTIYISRISVKSGNEGLAKPCSECQAMLFEAGIRNVYYTTGNESFEHLLLTKSNGYATMS